MVCVLSFKFSITILASRARKVEQLLERLYVFSIVWSIGAFLEIDDRIKLDAFLMTHFSHLALPPKDPESEDTVFDFVVGTDGDFEILKPILKPLIIPR